VNAEKGQVLKISAIIVTIQAIGNAYSGPTNANRKTAEASATDAGPLVTSEETAKLLEAGRLETLRGKSLQTQRSAVLIATKSNQSTK